MTSLMDATEEGEQNNLKQNNMHESCNGIETYTGNFKAGIRRHNHGIIIMPSLS